MHTPSGTFSCASVHVRVCVHVYLCACVEARTQPQVLLLAIIYFFFEMGSLSSLELPVQTRLAVQ